MQLEPNQCTYEHKLTQTHETHHGLDLGKVTILLLVIYFINGNVDYIESQNCHYIVKVISPIIFEFITPSHEHQFKNRVISLENNFPTKYQEFSNWNWFDLFISN